MGLLKTLYKKNQYNNFYIGLDLLPAKEAVPTGRPVKPYEPIELPAKEIPVRKSVKPYESVQLPENDMPVRRVVKPYEPIELPAKEIPVRRVMLGPQISEVAEDEVELRDEKMFEKLLITDLLRSGQ